MLCEKGASPFTRQSRLLMTLKKKPSENIAGKGENAGTPQCFLSILKRISVCKLHLQWNLVTSHFDGS